jgi:hypothetical protein
MQNKQKRNFSFKISLLFPLYPHQQLLSKIFLNLIIKHFRWKYLWEKHLSKLEYMCRPHLYIYWKWIWAIADESICDRWEEITVVFQHTSHTLFGCKIWSTYIREHKKNVNIVQLCENFSLKKKTAKLSLKKLNRLAQK